MTVGSLFAGVGGIELGFKNVGFSILWANEIDKNACKTYRENHKNILYEKSICDLDVKKDSIAKVDVLTAGFPCQPFSVAGYRKGFDDTRGNMFFEILRLTDELQPPILFLENVKNLKGHDKGNTFKVIVSSLQERGYYVKDSILNSSEYGNVPQNRERIFIVAFKDKEAFDNFSFPKEKKLTQKIEDLLDENVADNFYYTSSRYHPILKEQMTKSDTLYQWRRVYVRENKSNLCPTLTANMGTGGHNVPLLKDKKDIRKLTPDECARFQGFKNLKFPKDMALSHRYKQIGNSVTVTVIEAIAKEIKKAVECANTSKNLKSVDIRKSA